MGHGEPVGLVPGPLQQLQGSGVVGQDDRLAAPRHEDLLDPLGQGDHGHAALPEALEHLQAGRELSLAPVDDHEVGQRREGLVPRRVVRREVLLALPGADPALEHLPHRREVVRFALLERADVEAAVVALLLRAPLEDDHRGHGVGAHQVGDVVALDPHRQALEPELLLELVEGLDAAPARALVPEPLLVEGERRVALGELQDPALVAPLGRAHLHARAAPLGQGAGERLPGRLVELALDDHLRRDSRAPGVVLGDELRSHLGDPELARVLQVEGLPVGEHPVADLEYLGVGLGPVDRHGDRVERADRAARHPLALEQRADRLQPVALQRGALVLLGLGGGLHPGFDLLLDLPVAAREEGDHPVDRLPVLGLGHVAHAGSPAPVDVEVQARRAAAPARFGPGAGADLEDLAEDVERLARAARVAVRAEVEPATAVLLAREVDPRELLVGGDGDVRVALVVAQPHVEARLVALDQALLGQQRLGLAVEGDEVDRLGDRDHLHRAAGDRRREVAGHALAQGARLADVDHLPGRVGEQVDAGAVRQGAALLAEPLLAVGHLSRFGHRARISRNPPRAPDMVCPWRPRTGPVLSARPPAASR